MSYQSVETTNGFHIHGTFVDKARIDWSDGSYTLIESVDHFSFNAVGTGTTVFAETHKDSGDFFTADGVFEFRDTFHEVEHLTATDGVVRVEFAKGHFHFSATAREKRKSRPTTSDLPDASAHVSNRIQTSPADVRSVPTSERSTFHA